MILDNKAAKILDFECPQKLHSSKICMHTVLPEKNQKKLLMTREAFIGEHNLKPLLAVHKRSIDWYSLLGNKPVISEVYSYDILVINTHS